MANAEGTIAQYRSSLVASQRIDNRFHSEATVGVQCTVIPASIIEWITMAGKSASGHGAKGWVIESAAASDQCEV